MLSGVPMLSLPGSSVPLTVPLTVAAAVLRVGLEPGAEVWGKPGCSRPLPLLAPWNGPFGWRCQGPASGLCNCGCVSIFESPSRLEPARVEPQLYLD